MASVRSSAALRVRCPLLSTLERAIEEKGTAALHIALLARIADGIMVLRHGEMSGNGPTRQIIKAPQQEDTRALVNVRTVVNRPRNSRT